MVLTPADMEAQMRTDRQLRIVVQATGMYFAAHSVFNLLTAVTR